MKVYLANYATATDFDCLRDDGGYDNIADMAHAGIAGISLSGSPEWVNRMKEEIVDNVVESEGEDNYELRSTLMWRESPHVGTWHLINTAEPDGHNLSAVLVIWEGEADE